MNKGREYIKDLEKTGKYVFHGSSDETIEKLEPRQAYNYPGDGSAKIPDGPPSVAASPYADIAIFRSLVGFGSSFGASTKESGEVTLCFRAKEETLNESKDKTGFVYILDKTLFAPKEGTDINSMDWRSPEYVKLIEIVEVNYSDLPEGIKVIEK